MQVKDDIGRRTFYNAASLVRVLPMFKHCVLLASVLALSGCISPGPLGESEFIEQVLPVDHDTALANLREGWQVCTDGRFGHPSIIQFKDHTIIDVYGVTTYLKELTNQTVGRVEIWQIDNRVKVRAGVHKNYGNRRRQNWLKWAAGDFDCKL